MDIVVKRLLLKEKGVIEKNNWKWCVPWKFQKWLSLTCLFQQDIPSNPSQTVPPNEGQIFKYLNLWEASFSFKPSYVEIKWFNCVCFFIPNGILWSRTVYVKLKMYFILLFSCSLSFLGVQNSLKRCRNNKVPFQHPWYV